MVQKPTAQNSETPQACGVLHARHRGPYEKQIEIQVLKSYGAHKNSQDTLENQKTFTETLLDTISAQGAQAAQDAQAAQPRPLFDLFFYTI